MNLPSEDRPAAVTIDGEHHWDRAADVVVLGSGIAGCSTAVNCAGLGLSVIVLEKSREGGGTSAKAAGGMMVPNSRYMQRAGLEDPREDFIRFLARAALS